MSGVFIIQKLTKYTNLELLQNLLMYNIMIIALKLMLSVMQLGEKGTYSSVCVSGSCSK